MAEGLKREPRTNNKRELDAWRRQRTLTAGSILFSGSKGFVSQDNDNFFWDDINKRLGIRTNVPDASIHTLGSIHVETDSTVDGVRNQKYYCEAYSNTSRTIVIVTANVWHPAFNFLQGECSDFIEDSGGLATITAIAQNGSDIRITTAAAHGFEVGDPVSFVGGTGYDTQYMITAVPSSTKFDVTATYVATGTGFAIVGDNIEVPVNGIYRFDGFFSGNGLTGASTFEFTAVIDDVLVNKGNPSRKFSNTTDRGNMAGGWLLNLTAGQKLSFVARNTANTNNFTSSGTDLSIFRI